MVMQIGNQNYLENKESNQSYYLRKNNREITKI